jgi:polyisoprenoid-binding protein YceI
MTSDPATDSAVQPALVHYRLVAGESTFTVQAFSGGLFSAFGHDPVIAIRNFSGALEFVPETFESASLRVSIDVNSLAVAGDVKERDRTDIERTMREQVLEVQKYPEIAFSSNNISTNRLAEGRYRARIIGDLTLHGARQKNLWISAEATLKDDMLVGRGEFSLKQTDFGIKPFSAVGGTIKLTNELKFVFEIVARK